MVLLLYTDIKHRSFYNIKSESSGRSITLSIGLFGLSPRSNVWCSPQALSSWAPVTSWDREKWKKDKSGKVLFINLSVHWKSILVEQSYIS